MRLVNITFLLFSLSILFFNSQVMGEYKAVPAIPNPVNVLNENVFQNGFNEGHKIGYQEGLRDCTQQKAKIAILTDPKVMQPKEELPSLDPNIYHNRAGYDINPSKRQGSFSYPYEKNLDDNIYHRR